MPASVPRAGSESFSKVSASPSGSEQLNVTLTDVVFTVPALTFEQTGARSTWNDQSLLFPPA